MSLKKSALKRSAMGRLSWLAGSSLLTASLAAASSLALAPTAASAQTCSPLTAPGAVAGPDTYDCLAGTFPTGITYSSDGNLTVNMIANGAVVNTTLTANGANLTGNGADSVTWNSMVGTLTGGAGTAGPVIDALTATGAINISATGISATASGATNAIRARSTSGAITISAGTASTFVFANTIGIDAATAGNINITSGSFVSGSQRGIRTDTSSGAGLTTITTNGAVGGGIEAITGTGALLVTMNAAALSDIAVVRTTGPGAATININTNVRLARLDLNSTGATTVNIGPLALVGQHIFATQDFLFTVGAPGGPVVVNNTNGRIVGRFDWGAATGDITINNMSGGDAERMGWSTGGTTRFGSGDDLVNNGPTGVITGAPITTLEFGAGDDRFVNTGRLMTNVWNFHGVGPMTFTGLETFENSGLILLGSEFLGLTPNHTGLVSDGVPDDRLIAHGTDFVGSGASRIALDVNLADITQADCTATPASDCVDFSGGSTSGSTLLTIRDARQLNYIGALNAGITILLGVSSADDFTIDPSSEYYGMTATGPVLQKQLVAYRLVYDDAAETLTFVGTLADEAVQASTFAASAQETWRSAVGTWFTRQADLRATPGGLEDSSGAWARVGASSTEREASNSYVQGATTYSYDLTHKQNVSHLVFGADLLRLTGPDGGVVVGGMIGFVRSDVAFDASPSETVSAGFTGGLYASYAMGPLFVDAVVNANLLHVTAHVPNMQLGVDVPLKHDLRSFGGQVEAGWRFDLGGGAFVEPLAGAAYVTTEMDDIDMPSGGGAIDFEDKYTSLRAGAGLRLGMEAQLLGLPSSYSLTARSWREMEGENATAIVLTGGSTTTPLTDDVSGDFAEVAGALSLYSEGGGASGFISLGGRFGEDYRSIDGSVGVRLRW